MRVIAGLAKGRILSTPKGRKTRFTADRVKDSLFNILGQDLRGKSFLDLFAGVGSIGIEALSRGAKPVMFVEKDVQNADYIRKNLENCRFSKGVKVYNLSFRQAIKKLLSTFDYIFLDPPYSAYPIEKILHNLYICGIVSGFSTTIVEHSKKDIVPSRLEGLILARRKVYGQTVLSFYKKNEKSRHLSRKF